MPFLLICHCHICSSYKFVTSAHAIFFMASDFRNGTCTLALLGLSHFAMKWILLQLICVITELLIRSTNMTRQPNKNVSAIFTSLFFIESSITEPYNSCYVSFVMNNATLWLRYFILSTLWLLHLILSGDR